MRLTTVFWSHDDCGCQKAPIVGARYRKMSRDVLTGEEHGWRYYTVTAVEPLRQDRLFCRRVFFRGDTGWQGASQVQNFLASYEAIENVLQLPVPEDRYKIRPEDDHQ